MRQQTAKAGKPKRAKPTPEQRQAERERAQKLEILDTREAAALLGVSRQLLEGLRVHGGGCEFFKFGRVVRYKRDALLAWYVKHTVASTSARSPK